MQRNMQRRRRTRAAIKDIYPGCLTGGYCPPDVKNKVEGTTPADYILKILGSLVFFGGLGISSASGSGGRFGYRPLGGSSTAVRPNTTVRPPAGAVDTLGAEIFTGSTVDASSPSVITLTDVVPEETVIDSGPTAGGPTVVSTSGEDPFTVDVSSNGTRGPELTVTSTHLNPTFDAGTFSTTSVVSGPHVEVEGPFTEAVVGPELGSRLPIPETIELATFSNTNDTFDTAIIDTTEFSASTPKEVEPRVIRPKFYSKRYTQVAVENPLFLSEPQGLVQTGFEGEGADTSINFDVGPPPTDDAFQDVIHLSRPYTTQRPSGHIRVSRLGQVSSLSTRSGKIIGPHKHYYFDLSSIAEGENIELQVLDGSGPGVAVEDPNIALDEISLTDTLQSTYSDEDLLDVYETISEHAHLIIGGGGRRRIPQTIPINQYSFYKPLVSVDIDYSHPTNSIAPGQQPVSPYTPKQPDIPYSPVQPGQIDVSPSALYYGYYPFDPSLFGKVKKKKKKRPII